MDNRTSLFDVVVGILQSLVVVLHEVGDAQTGRATDARQTVHQGLASALVGLSDLLGYTFKMDGKVGSGEIVYVDLNTLDAGEVQVGEVFGAVDDVGDAKAADSLFTDRGGAA